MRLAFVVNEIAGLKPSQTSHHLMREAARMGHEVWLCDVLGLDLTERRAVVADGCQVVLDGKSVDLEDPSPLHLADVDHILVRTNPGRDSAHLHSHALEVLALLEDQGTSVINAPSGLQRFASKLGLMRLPARIRPATLVTRSASAVRAFVEDHGRSVLKPTLGTRGDGVFFVEPGDANIRATVDMLIKQGALVCQEWLPLGVDGDVRLFLVDGEPLLSSGIAAAVRRRPAPGELRSNVHLGGVPERADMTPELETIAAYAGPVLRDLGLRVVGLDCIGDRVVEANVFSPGGLTDMERFHGVPFVRPLLEQILG